MAAEIEKRILEKLGVGAGVGDEGGDPEQLTGRLLTGGEECPDDAHARAGAGTRPGSAG